MGQGDSMSARKPLVVRATWDDEAKVWVATSDDVPGLATEAKTCDALLKKLRVIIPELLEANGIVPNSVDEVPIELVSMLSMRTKTRAAA